MNLLRVCGCFCAAVFLLGCDSQGSNSTSSISTADASRPLNSRPASSVELDVFNDVVAPNRVAPQLRAAGTTNLLTNPSFENGAGGWNNCASGPLSVSNDASEGIQALKIEPNNCVYRSVQVDPRATYFLSCDVKIDPTKAWTGMGLVFANNDYVSLLDAPVATATSSDYMTLTSKGTAPAGTAFVSMWVHSDFGALVDNCSLLLENDRPAVVTTSGNLLDNSSFSSLDATGDLESWTSGCDGEVVTSNPSDTNGTSEPNLTNDTNITLANGACVDQSLNTVAIESIQNSFARFGCYISGSDGYSDMSVYLDGKLAASQQIQYTQNNTFVSVDLDVSSASNGFVTLYSEGELTAENCTFDTTASTPSDNPSAGSIPVEFESTTLEQLVKDRLSITDGPVTRDDMLLLTSLFSFEGNAELDSLVGLEYAKNLSAIDFSEAPIKSLEPLAGLTSLEFLFIYDAVLESVAPLAELNSLHWFVAGTAPELSDISVFANHEFPNLNYLGFEGSSSISDLTPLSGLPLLFLNVKASKVTDLSPIASMDELVGLVITGSSLPSLQPLIDGSIFTTDRSSIVISPEFVDLSEGSPDRLKLDELMEKKGEDFQIVLQTLSGEQTELPAPNTTDGDGTTVVEFESAVLEELVKSELSITGRSVTRDDMLRLTGFGSTDSRGANVTSLVGLEFAFNLERFWPRDWPITSLEPLEELSSLVSIVSFGSSIDSLAPLAGHTSLEQIFFSDAPIESIPPLEGFTELRSITLPNARLDSLASLAGLTSLERLLLPKSSVDSLAPLAGMTSLFQVVVSTAPELSDLSVFANNAFPRLSNLELLGSSSISDLTPLTGSDELYSLIIRNGKVTDPSPIASIVNLFQLELSGSELINLQPLADGTIFTERDGSHLILNPTGLDLSEGSADRVALEDFEANKIPGFRVLLRSPENNLSFLDGSAAPSSYATR